MPYAYGIELTTNALNELELLIEHDSELKDFSEARAESNPRANSAYKLLHESGLVEALFTWDGRAAVIAITERGYGFPEDCA